MKENQNNQNKHNNKHIELEEVTFLYFESRLKFSAETKKSPSNYVTTLYCYTDVML